MSWTIDDPQHTKGAVFTITARFNAGLADDFAFQGSVNLEDDGSLDDFIARARAAHAEANQVDETRTKYSKAFTRLEAQLNKAETKKGDKLTGKGAK